MIRQARGLYGVTLSAALTACATKQPPIDFASVPRAHVVVVGEAPDTSSAYVLVVPHTQVRHGYKVSVLGATTIDASPAPTFRTWLTSSPPTEGRSIEESIEVPSDRPTILRLPPGRYYVSRVFVTPYYYDLDQNQSSFDARSGQLNYPGDWTVDAGYHELTRGAQHTGSYYLATLIEGDSGALARSVDASSSIAGLPRAYTRVTSQAEHGIGDR
jgi:hypothetical protein